MKSFSFFLLTYLTIRSLTFNEVLKYLFWFFWANLGWFLWSRLWVKADADVPLVYMFPGSGAVHQVPERGPSRGGGPCGRSTPCPAEEVQRCECQHADISSTHTFMCVKVLRLPRQGCRALPQHGPVQGRHRRLHRGWRVEQGQESRQRAGAQVRNTQQTLIFLNARTVMKTTQLK